MHTVHVFTRVYYLVHIYWSIFTGAYLLMFCTVHMYICICGFMVALPLSCLQISIQQLNFRLSYNDIKLFVAIAQSLPSFSSEKREPRPKQELDGEQGMEKACS